MLKCTKCSADVDELAVFPGGVCLACYAESPEGKRMPTADEVVAMWGGTPHSAANLAMDDASVQRRKDEAEEFRAKYNESN